MATTMNKQNKRQASKAKPTRLAAERRTAENKIRRQLRQLKRSQGKDSTAARAIVEAVHVHPHLRNLKV